MATNKVTSLVNYDQPKHEKSSSMSEDPTFEDRLETSKKIDELIDETDDLLELNDSKTNKTHDNRIKHKNRRYTQSCEYPEGSSSANNKFSSTLSASLPDHFTFNNTFAAKNWSKKFSKNSRRSRRERSRGLAKKGKHTGGSILWTISVWWLITFSIKQTNFV